MLQGSKSKAESNFKNLPDSHFYAVVDGAALPEVRHRLWQDNPQHCCLWSGKLPPDLEQVAPYLIHLPQQTAFSDWLLEMASRSDCAVFIKSQDKVSITQLRKSLRKHLLVNDSEGNTLVFRFYDPRVLGCFIDIASQEQRNQLFENIDRYILIQQETLETYHNQTVLSASHSGKGRMMITTEQMQKMDLSALDNYLTQLVEDIQAVYPDHFLNETDEALKERFRLCIAKAEEFNIVGRTDLFEYCSLCIQWGDDFCGPDGLIWAKNIVEDPFITDGAARVTLLIQAGAEYRAQLNI
ncbi:DUF4123 domain-containing protein [Amphritea sp.]|uniref:DUF4123 domain-containing protein n=1 Tax=Amphritea sp. TaxID=1872502 RepID=UPI003D0E39D8